MQCCPYLQDSFPGTLPVPLFSPRVFLMAIARAGEHLQKGSGVVFQSCS